MNREEQLSWEARVGRLVAIAAFASAVVLVASLIYSSSTLNERTNDTVDGLRLLHDHKGEVFVTTLLQSLSTALLAPVLWFLYKVTRYRRQELQPIARYMALIAPPAAGLLAVIRQIQVAGISDKVIDHLSANPLPPGDANQYAKDQLAHGSVQLVGGLALAAGLALAFCFIMIALNAMRAGVLSRFMGIVGIIVGVLFVIPLLGSVPIVEVFWVAALGLLFLDKWPQGGRGPAWDSGEAIPWPTAQDRATAMAEARADRELAEGGDDDDVEAEPVATGGRQEGGGHPVAREHQHPRSKKRKRRRR
jgi:amino acid transporter